MSSEALQTIESSQAIIQFFEGVSGVSPVYALIAAAHQGKWIWGRKAENDTWEIPGGHIEPGESPEQAAARELEEETGAREYSLTPVSVYSVRLKNKDGHFGQAVYGCLFYAEITQFRALRDEIVEIVFLEALPERLSYQDIQPHLLGFVQSWLKSRPAGSIPAAFQVKTAH